MQIRKYIKWSINYNKWKVHPTKSEISTCMKSPRASITNTQIPSISTYCTHIITAASSQLLSIGQWQGYIVKCQPTSSIDISIAGKNNRTMSKLIILYLQRKIQWLLKATHGWRLADHPAWASNCEGLICSPKKITQMRLTWEEIQELKWNLCIRPTILPWCHNNYRQFHFLVCSPQVFSTTKQKYFKWITKIQESAE